MRKSEELANYLEPYVEMNAITHALYDPSGGRGKEFDTESAVRTLKQLRAAFPQLKLGVAGGLSPDNVRAKLERVWREDPLASIDIEGRVRNPETDDLDIDRTIDFVTRALGFACEIDSDHLQAMRRRAARPSDASAPSIDTGRQTNS